MPGITEEWKFIQDGPKLKYCIKIFGFRNKMKTWCPGREVWSQVFCIGDSEFSVDIYPNGSVKGNRGHISVYLQNKNDWDVNVNVTFKIGRSNRSEVFEIPADSRNGWPQFCKHEEIIGREFEYGGVIGADGDAMDASGKLTAVIVMSVVREEVTTARRDVKYLHEESKEEVESLKSEVSNLKSEIKTLIFRQESGRKDLKRLMPETKTEIAGLKSEMADLKDEIKSLVSKIEDLVKPVQKSPPPSIPCPECPVCFDEMKPPLRIFQCKSGHLICINCLRMPEV